MMIHALQSKRAKQGGELKWNEKKRKETKKWNERQKNAWTGRVKIHNIETIQFGSVVIFQNLIVLRTNISHSTTHTHNKKYTHVYKGFADRTL